MQNTPIGSPPQPLLSGLTPRVAPTRTPTEALQIINPKVIELYLGVKLELLIVSDRDRGMSNSFREAVNTRTHK